MAEIYTVGQLAKIIGVAPETIKKWEDAKLIPASGRMTRRNTRVWNKPKACLILRFAREYGYPVPSEADFLTGRYLST